jgi:hypothetical protein
MPNQICGAKLVGQDAYCDRPPVPGKRRCERHGGLNTGPKSVEGMAAVAERMKLGRLDWIAKMRAEGRPLPFAGFRPKGSGTPREARQKARHGRQAQRQAYSQAKAAVDRARVDLTLIRAARTLAQQPDPGNPEWQSRMLPAFETFFAMPQRDIGRGHARAGPRGRVEFDSEILRSQISAYRVLSPAMSALIGQWARAEKERQYQMRASDKSTDPVGRPSVSAKQEEQFMKTVVERPLVEPNARAVEPEPAPIDAAPASTEEPAPPPPIPPAPAVPPPAPISPRGPRGVILDWDHPFWREDWDIAPSTYKRRA